MGQMSNKTLVFLLIAVIVVSVGGTIISLNRVNQLMQGGITGMAGSGTGMVNVTIIAVSSITLIDSQIDFGSCSPNASTGANVSSNDSSEWGAPGVCAAASYSAPDNITVQNDGNKNVNVTVKTNVVASTLIGGTDPAFYFITRNASTRPGCFNYTGGSTSSGFDGTMGMQWVWKDFAAANTEYLACDNLTYGDSNDQFSLFALLDLPPDTPVRTGQNATLTFTAVAYP